MELSDEFIGSVDSLQIEMFRERRRKEDEYYELCKVPITKSRNIKACYDLIDKKINKTRPSRPKNVWTQDAYNCWKSKADCEHCTINTCYHMKYYCRMPESVQVLLDTIGEPTTDVFREGSMDE